MIEAARAHLISMLTGEASPCILIVSGHIWVSDWGNALRFQEAFNLEPDAFARWRENERRQNEPHAANGQQNGRENGRENGQQDGKQDERENGQHDLGQLLGGKAGFESALAPSRGGDAPRVQPVAKWRAREILALGCCVVARR